MKSFLSASAFTTGGITFAIMVGVGAIEGIVYAQALPAIGAETPVSGITIGILAAGVIASVALIWRGAKSLIALGEYVAELRAALRDGTSAMKSFTVQAELIGLLTNRIGELEVWRGEVDPFISEALRTRLGLDRSRELPGA